VNYPATSFVPFEANVICPLNLVLLNLATQQLLPVVLNVKLHASLLLEPEQFRRVLPQDE
jgi:hypothetical protein